MHANVRAMTGALAVALFVVGGCRSTSTDRIRVLEAERADLARQNEHLKGQVADTRSQQLEAESQAKRSDAELRALRERLDAQRASTAAPAQAPASDHTAVVDSSALRSELANSGVQVEPRPGGEAALVLASDVTFKPGRADLSKKAVKTLRTVAQVLKKTAGLRQVRVEGHTDADPIRKSGWESNQALSRARADVVRKFLIAQGLADSMLAAKGFGADRPVEPNDTAAHKAANRRVEIVLVPRS